MKKEEERDDPASCILGLVQIENIGIHQSLVAYKYRYQMRAEGRTEKRGDGEGEGEGGGEGGVGDLEREYLYENLLNYPWCP